MIERLVCAACFRIRCSPIHLAARVLRICPGDRTPKPDRTIEIPGPGPGQPSGILEFDRPLTDAEYEAIKARWRWLAIHGKHGTPGVISNAHKVGIIGENGEPICTCTHDSRCAWHDETTDQD